MSSEVLTRPARLEDMAAILGVEEAWPEGARAEEAKFRARLERFPPGFWVAEVAGPHGEHDMAATITSMPMRYETDQMDSFGNWDQVTHQGFLPPTWDEGANALYIVSGVIAPRYRGLNIFAPMVLRLVQVARDLGLRYVLAGAVLPGYDAHCSRHGEVAAHKYCFMRRGSHLVDPLLAMYEAIGFAVPDRQHVLSNYFPDADSRDHAALVVCDLEAATAPISRAC